MSLEAYAMGGGGVAAAEAATVPESVDFNGDDNYVEKTSLLTGVSNEKFYTFSCWVYYTKGGTKQHLMHNTDGQFIVTIEATGKLSIVADAANGTLLLNVSTVGVIPASTWVHVLVSVDLRDTAKREIYINDVSDAGTWSTYVSGSIGWDDTTVMTLGAHFQHTFPLLGRLAHVYLDYTYRDLDTESNRRLFNQISDTEGLIPKSIADVASLSPLMYLPLQLGDLLNNEGTGGDFNTDNGNFARSQRGPNQYNGKMCTQTDADFATLASVGAITSNKFLTLSFVFKTADTSSNFRRLFNIDQASRRGIQVYYQGSTGNLTFNAQDNAGSTNILNATIALIQNVTYRVQLTCDVSDTGKRMLIINGIDRTADVSWNSYTNQNFEWANLNDAVLGGFTGAGTTSWVGDLGEIYMTNEYLSTLAADANPFVEDDNLCKYLGADGSLPTGTQPLFYWPVESGNEGVNLGSEGDATVTSGPWTGARGGSEYVARSVWNEETSNSFQRVNFMDIATLSGASSSQADFTVFCPAAATLTAQNTNFLFASGDDFDDVDNITGRTDSNETANFGLDELTEVSVTGAWKPSSTWRTPFFTRTGTIMELSIEGNQTSADISLGLDLTLPFTLGSTSGSTAGTWDWVGYQGIFYLGTTYYDAGDDADRLLFLDAFGYPRDLSIGIANETIAEPLIYMRYEDPDDLGANSGTGGDFTITGTMVQGRDVMPTGEW